jgi:hypothetical protein
MTDKAIAKTFWGASSQNGMNNNKGFFSPTSAPTRREETQPVVLTGKQHVTALRNNLGFFDRIAVDRVSREECRRVIGELVVNLLEKQKQEIVFKMGLELADEKKIAFAESLRAGARVEKEIAERSTEFERELIDLALNHGLAGHEHKKTRLAQLDDWHSAGKIDEQSYVEERHSIENWMSVFRANLDAKVEIILRNHAQQIVKALALFQERAFPSHEH